MSTTILWVDDEIELLKPYMIFLREKGYEVVTCNNGRDAIDMVKQESFDIMFLDENMPGVSGLEVLAEVTKLRQGMPVVMITKNEQEDIMDQAIGQHIADFLIKPVNPSQILLTLKKHLHKDEIVNTQNITNFRSEFQQLGTLISDKLTMEEWYDLHRRLTRWDLELADGDQGLHSMLHSVVDDANLAFQKFVRNNYLDWMKGGNQAPLMSWDIVRQRIFPLLDNNEKVLMVVIDNMRYDQWFVIQDLLGKDFTVTQNELYCSILPTATQYARNAIFAGLTPLQIAKRYPDWWVEEVEEEGKNLYEFEMLVEQLRRNGRNVKVSYHKCNNSASIEQASNDLRRSGAELCVAVVNFVDMLSHARTDNKMIRELASSEAAYRKLSSEWIRRSGLIEMLKTMGRKGYKIIITTDHGTTHVDHAIKVIGDRNTSVSLRYKVGKSLNFDKKDLKEIFEIKKPEEAGLPMPNLSSTYIFATGKGFLAYPNNYNYYVTYYKDTFQHGGISMEEMLIPLVQLKLN